MEKEPIVEAMFQSSIYVELGDGRKALFWTDCWLQGQSLLDLTLCLCSVVGARIKGQRTVAEALSRDQWIGDISGALTKQILLDYLQVWDWTRHIQLSENQPDRICWKWMGTESSPPPPRTWLSSLDNIRLKVQNCSTKHELRPSANSSFGLCSMTDVICKLASHLVVS